MADGRPHPSVDDLFDAFIVAWHAGQAPSLDACVAQAAPSEQEELTQLIGSFLQLAPTVEVTPERAAELVDDPLVERLAALEGDWWDRREALAAAPWGERLRTLRETAGVSLAALGGRFAERFGLAGDDATRAPDVLGELEAGALPGDGVAARAARALEELLGAAAGTLTSGAAPAVGGALLRGTLPDDAAGREQLADLLREVDDALPPVDGGVAGESLRDLLGG